jgi:hypothetical protein
VKRVAVIVFACALAACGRSDGTYALLSQDAHGARFRVTCAPSRIEVGVRQRSPLAEDATRKALDQLPFASRVRLLDATGAQLISETEATTPIVMWMSPGKPSQVEYIGLQEVDVPFARWQCRDYVVALEFDEIPAWAKGDAGVEPYLRKSGRP